MLADEPLHPRDLGDSMRFGMMVQKLFDNSRSDVEQLDESEKLMQDTY